jgi:hypothetical protein
MRSVIGFQAFSTNPIIPLLAIGIGRSSKMSSNHGTLFPHDPDEGLLGDATCAECKGKAKHYPNCSFRTMEEEVRAELEARKEQDAAREAARTSSIPHQPQAGPSQ